MMTSLNPSQEIIGEWVRKQKARRSEIVPLAAAWFGNSLTDYTIYRLGYFGLNTLLMMSLHIVEFYLLTKIFDHSLLHSVLVVRLSSFAIGAAWWGALEVMRKRVRLLKGQTNRIKLANELGRWYLFGYCWCGFFCLVALYYGYSALISDGTTRLGDLYCAVIFFSLGLRFFVEAKKAGVYAISRIWRPLWSILIIPVMGLVLMLAFWWWLGMYAVVIALLFTRLLSSYASFYFTSRAQANLQYPEVVWPTLVQYLVFLKGLMKWEFFAPALAFLVIDITGLMVVLISAISDRSAFADSTFMMFYLVNPLLRAASDWAMLFYFDFKKYQQGMLESFVPSFTKRFFWNTPFIGLVFGSLAIITTIGYFNQNVYLISLIFLVLFVLRSSIAFLQIIAFCQERYVRAIVSGACILVAVMGIAWTSSPDDILTVLFIGLGISLLTAIAPGLFTQPKRSLQQELTMHAWYRRLKNEKRSVQLWRFQVEPQTHFRRKMALLRLLLPKAIQQSSAWFWLDQDTVLGYTVGHDLSHFFQKMMIRQAGLVHAYQILPRADNGKLALHQARGLLTAGVVSNLEDKLSGAELIERFTQRFPEGWYHRGQGRLLGKEIQHVRLKNEYYRSLLYKITRTMRSPCDCSEDSDLSLSVAFPTRGRPLIFVVPYSYENRRSAAEWKKSVYLWNVGQAVGAKSS